jgi:hypothetical protein
MATFRLATTRRVRDPVRVQEWDASIAAGDDFKIALTVYGDDSGVAADVTGSRSRLALWPEDYLQRHGRSSDYGASAYTGGSDIPSPHLTTCSVDGSVTTIRAGGVNFLVPSAVTSRMRRRYRMALSVDLADGSFCQVEGVLQLRHHVGHHVVPAVYTFFTLDISQLDVAILAPAVVGGVITDLDGFFLANPDPAIPPPPDLVVGIYGVTVLGDGSVYG